MSNTCSKCFYVVNPPPLSQAGLIVLALPISIVAAYGHLPLLQIDTTPTGAD